MPFLRLLPIAAVLSAMIVLSGCSRVALFDTLVPKDVPAGETVRDLVYADHARGKLDIYGAAGEGAEKKPVIFFVYGGSWQSGDKDDYSFVGRALAARGYIVIIADYRLVPEVGYPVFVEDGAAALAWTYRNIERYGGDPAMLFVSGHSAGAYNAVMLAMEPQFLRKEGLERSIIGAVVALSGPYDFLPLDDDATIAAFSDAEDLQATQPVNLPVRDMPPMLLLHGEKDTLVLPRNTRALADHLEEGDASVRTRYYEGIDHTGTLLALSRPFRGSAPTLDDIDAFLSAR